MTDVATPTFLSSAGVSPHSLARALVRSCWPVVTSPLNCSWSSALLAWQNQKNALEGFLGAFGSTSPLRLFPADPFPVDFDGFSGILLIVLFILLVFGGPKTVRSGTETGDGMGMRLEGPCMTVDWGGTVVELLWATVNLSGRCLGLLSSCWVPLLSFDWSDSTERAASTSARILVAAAVRMSGCGVGTWSGWGEGRMRPVAAALVDGRHFGKSTSSYCSSFFTRYL